MEATPETKTPPFHFVEPEDTEQEKPKPKQRKRKAKAVDPESPLEPKPAKRPRGGKGVKWDSQYLDMLNKEQAAYANSIFQQLSDPAITGPKRWKIIAAARKNGILNKGKPSVTSSKHSNEQASTRAVSEEPGCETAEDSSASPVEDDAE